MISILLITFIIKVKLPYESVCHNFLIGREVQLPCSYTSTGFLYFRKSPFAPIINKQYMYICKVIYNTHPDNRLLPDCVRVLFFGVEARVGGEGRVTWKGSITRLCLLLIWRNMKYLNLPGRKRWFKQSDEQHLDMPTFLTHHSLTHSLIASEHLY